VRLQQIADETGISVGNLAYHYSNKEAIAESLIAHIIEELENILRSYGSHASFSDLDIFSKNFIACAILTISSALIFLK